MIKNAIGLHINKNISNFAVIINVFFIVIDFRGGLLVKVGLFFCQASS